MVTKPSAAAKKAPATPPAKTSGKTSGKTAAKTSAKASAKPPARAATTTPPSPPARPVVKTPAKAPVKAPAKPAAKAPRKASGDPFDQYRQSLLVRQEELLLDISRNRQVTVDTVDEQAQDMVDRATSAYTREFAFSLSEADRKALLLIEQALLRMDQGTYGVCVHCQGVVQEKRLEAVPWARHCLDCQEMQDKGLL